MELMKLKQSSQMEIERYKNEAKRESEKARYAEEELKNVKKTINDLQE
jgi:hypothetical protein